MKRKMLVKWMAWCAVAALAFGSLTGCAGKGDGGKGSGGQSVASGEQAGQEGTSEEKAPRILLKDVELEKYFSMGDYQNLRVTKEEVIVPEEEVTSVMNQQYLANFPEEMGVLDKEIAVGDTVYIDYEGKLDGVAFDGGTGTNYPLKIGSHTFINGFEDGLVGVKGGESIDLNLTFPEDYRTADLAGKDVVFTVKINYIIPEQIMEEVIPKLGIENVSTLAEYRQYFYDMLYEEKAYNIQQNFENSVYEAFMDLCEFQEMPANLLQSTKDVIEGAIRSSAAMYGVDADTFVSYVYGTDLATFLDNYAEPALKQNIALYQMAKEESLIPSDEELLAVLTDYASETGYEDAQAYLTAVGSSLEEFKEDYSISMAYDRLLEIAGQ